MISQGTYVRIVICGEIEGEIEEDLEGEAAIIPGFLLATSKRKEACFKSQLYILQNHYARVSKFQLRAVGFSFSWVYTLRPITIFHISVDILFYFIYFATHTLEVGLS